MHYGKGSFAQIIVPRESIPDGVQLVEAYETEREIIICGDPPEESDKPEENRHNCDAMGCSSVNHVTYRFRKGESEKAFELLERAAGMMENESPDKTWFEEYFGLTGEHMILTEDGWLAGTSKTNYQPEDILAEVNAPV